MEAFKIFKSKRYKTAPPITAEEYYVRMGRRTKSVAIVLALVTALLIIAVATAYSSELTVENLRYMLKFIDTEAATVAENDVVNYDSDDGNTGMLVRGNLAVYNSAGLSVYDLSGEKQQTATFRTEDACAAVTDKYLIMCDLGGTELRVFSPYQEVYSETFSYPILGIASSPGGSFAVISSAKSYRSAVYVYNPYFRVIYTRKFGDYYASAVAVSDAGDEFLTAVQYSENGQLVTGLYRFSVDEEQPKLETTFAGELPIRVAYLGNGGFALLTDTALRFFDVAGTLTGTVDLSGRSLQSYCFGGGCAALFYSSSGLSASSEMVCYDSRGNALLSETFASQPIDKVFAGGRIYVLTRGILYSYDLAGEEAFTSFAVGDKCVQLLCDSDMLLLFSGDSSIVYKTFAATAESETSQ